MGSWYHKVRNILIKRKISMGAAKDPPGWPLRLKFPDGEAYYSRRDPKTVMTTGVIIR